MFRPLPALLAVPLIALLAGCGEKTVSQGEVESQVKASLTEKVGQAPKAITCPSDLPAEVGATMTCTLVATDDSEVDVAVEVTSIDGDTAKFGIEVGTEVRR